MSLKLWSKAFDHGGEIPRRYTCDGENISPALEWSGVPQGTQSLVLVIADPDAPDPAAPLMTWVHWLLFNIPPLENGLPEAVESSRLLPAGTCVGANSGKRNAYSGPCPPVGRHRYFHKLYALDTVLDDSGIDDVDDLERAMSGHIIAKAEFFATYARHHG
ncbi:MAG: YbhB/YbcL family Raf kinase inhibitor-like protein [Acidiferrobacteraceae bacterium]|jgi:Raf kinase inhibitor-like YbhB/YbcL family protein